MVSGKREDEELERTKARSRMTVRFAVHREGLLRWRRSHRSVGQVGLLPCVSFLHSRTHTRAHSKHTHLESKDREGKISRAGCSGSCGFQSVSPLQLSLSGASRLGGWCAFCVIVRMCDVPIQV